MGIGKVESLESWRIGGAWKDWRRVEGGARRGVEGEDRGGRMDGWMDRMTEERGGDKIVMGWGWSGMAYRLTGSVRM